MRENHVDSRRHDHEGRTVMEQSTEGRDPEGGSRSAQPGGSPSRGPNPDPGGENDLGDEVPPYDGRTGTGSPSNEELAASVERQLAETKTSEPGQTASPADEQPVSEDQVTDEEPETPLGVGESINRRGEDVSDAEDEEGREETGTRGKSQRPVGKSDERDASSVNPQDSGEDSPTTPSGDQGG